MMEPGEYPIKWDWKSIEKLGYRIYFSCIGFSVEAGRVDENIDTYWETIGLGGIQGCKRFPKNQAEKMGYARNQRNVLYVVLQDYMEQQRLAYEEEYE
jgi:hypothetical protein